MVLTRLILINYLAYMRWYYRTLIINELLIINNSRYQKILHIIL